MKITNENNELVLKIPLFQNSYDAADNLIGKVHNLIGIIAGKEYSISWLIDLGYKGDQQEGSSVIMVDSAEDLKKECKKLGLDVWILPVCAYCGEAIRGCYTLGDKGNICFSCENKLTAKCAKI